MSITSQSALKSVTFGPRLADECTVEARKLSKSDCLWMSAVGVREYFGEYDDATQRVLEDIYWIVAQGKAAAELAGVAY